VIGSGIVGPRKSDYVDFSFTLCSSLPLADESLQATETYFKNLQAFLDIVEHYKTMGCPGAALGIVELFSVINSSYPMSFG
jgi:hypothetical protein